MESKKLQKPRFVKMSEIKPGKHCYNVYVKVLSAQETVLTGTNNQNMVAIEGVVGDESGSANFRIVTQPNHHLKKGNVVALRNGKSVIVDEHIVLQMDRFGKVSLENNHSITNVNTSVNISDDKWEKKLKN